MKDIELRTDRRIESTENNNYAQGYNGYVGGDDQNELNAQESLNVPDDIYEVNEGEVHLDKGGDNYVDDNSRDVDNKEHPDY